jgi:hypothetical protein
MPEVDVFEFGFFGGSNGYWDYRILVETGMDEGMLTEDVDSSFRAQAAGHRMTDDSTIDHSALSSRTWLDAVVSLLYLSLNLV